MFEALDKEGIFVRKLATNNVAFHCPLLDGCLDALRAGGPLKSFQPIVVKGYSVGQSCRRCWEVLSAWDTLPPHWLSSPAWLSQKMHVPSLISFGWASCRSGAHHPRSQAEHWPLAVHVPGHQGTFHERRRLPGVPPAPSAKAITVGARLALQQQSMAHPVPQVNSFRNQVLFRTAAASISDGAIVLEVGPHAVLRALLRQNK